MPIHSRQLGWQSAHGIMRNNRQFNFFYKKFIALGKDDSTFSKKVRYFDC